MWTPDYRCAWCCSSSALSSCFLSTIFTPFVQTDWEYKLYVDPGLSLCMVLLILRSVQLLLNDYIQCCGSGSGSRIRIRSGTKINVSDPKLDPKLDPELDPNHIYKKKPCFQAETRWFHMIIHISHLQVVATIAVQQNTFTCSCTQCCGSVTFWYRSGSADSSLLLMDPDLNPANLLHTLFVAKSWS